MDPGLRRDDGGDLENAVDPTTAVIPAKAGIQFCSAGSDVEVRWIRPSRDDGGDLENAVDPTTAVIPAQAGIQFCSAGSEIGEGRWIPAFAGMTVGVRLAHTPGQS